MLVAGCFITNSLLDKKVDYKKRLSVLTAFNLQITIKK